MSLDVHLQEPGEMESVTCRHTCPDCGKPCGNIHPRPRAEVFSQNITHNLNQMAKEAGIYMHLWRPDELTPPITKASELIEPLRAALVLMKSDPPRFERFNSPNGWGLYKHFVPWIQEYLDACIKNPDALVRVTR